jgi:hypothetical protein
MRLRYLEYHQVGLQKYFIPVARFALKVSPTVYLYNTELYAILVQHLGWSYLQKVSLNLTVGVALFWNGQRMFRCTVVHI